VHQHFGFKREGKRPQILQIKNSRSYVRGHEDFLLKPCEDKFISAGRECAREEVNFRGENSGI